MKRKVTVIGVGLALVLCAIAFSSAQFFQFSAAPAYEAVPGNAPTESRAQNSDSVGKAMPVQPPAPPMAGASTVLPASAPNAPNQAATERMIIRTANLALTVKDAEVALETVKNVTAQLGGFVSNSQAQRVSNKDQVSVNVTIRVPADKFDEALKQIKQTAIKVNTENISGQDVTEEFADLGAQLRNLEAVEKELLALLTTVREKSNRAEEILAVQRELNNTRLQIERLKGRMQFLERNVALATISVRLAPEAVEPPVVQQEGWDPARVARDALRALVNSLQALASIGIYLGIYVLPLLLLLALPIVMAWRWARRTGRARA